MSEYELNKVFERIKQERLEQEKKARDKAGNNISINTRVTPEFVKRIDEYAEAKGYSRANALRSLAELGIKYIELTGTDE